MACSELATTLAFWKVRRSTLGRPVTGPEQTMNEIADEDFEQHFRDRVFHIKDPDTGKLLHGEMDREYLGIMTEWHGTECKHETTKLMRCEHAGGSVHAYEVCTHCYEKRGTAVGAADLPVPKEELELLETHHAMPYRERRHAALKASLLELARSQVRQRGEFTRDYQEYIKSPKWKRKRELVLKRAGGMCEACGEAPAVEVHHHHYGSLGNEYLWDLAAVCRPCHERITEEMRDRRERRTA